LEKDTVKIADFGLATNEPNPTEIGVGSPPYMGPELFDTSLQLYSAAKADVWALGVIFFNLLFQVNPWERADMDDPHFVAHMKNPTTSLKNRFNLSDELNSIFSSVFQVDYRRRCSLKELHSKVLALNLFPISKLPPPSSPPPKLVSSIITTPPVTPAYQPISSSSSSFSSSPSTSASPATASTPATTTFGFQYPNKVTGTTSSVTTPITIHSKPESHNNTPITNSSLTNSGLSAKQGGSALTDALTSSPSLTQSKPINVSAATSTGRTANPYSSSTPKSSFDASFKSAVSSLKLGSSPMGINSFKTDTFSSSIASSWADDDTEMDYGNVPTFDDEESHHDELRSSASSMKDDSPNSFLDYQPNQSSSPSSSSSSSSFQNLPVPPKNTPTKQKPQGKPTHRDRPRDAEKGSPSPQREPHRNAKSQPRHLDADDDTPFYDALSTGTTTTTTTTTPTTTQFEFDQDFQDHHHPHNHHHQHHHPSPNSREQAISTSASPKKTSGFAATTVNEKTPKAQQSSFAAPNSPGLNQSPSPDNRAFYTPPQTPTNHSHSSSNSHNIHHQSPNHHHQQSNNNSSNHHSPSHQKPIQPKISTGFSVAAAPVTHTRKKSLGNSPFSSAPPTNPTQTPKNQIPTSTTTSTPPASTSQQPKADLSYLPSVASTVALEEIARVYDIGLNGISGMTALPKFVA